MTAQSGWCHPLAEGSDDRYLVGACRVGRPGLNGEQPLRIAVASRPRLRTRRCAVVHGLRGSARLPAAGITLMGSDQSGPICVSDSSVAALEDVQFTIGRGLRRDAHRSRRSEHALRLGVRHRRHAVGYSSCGSVVEDPPARVRARRGGRCGCYAPCCPSPASA